VTLSNQATAGSHSLVRQRNERDFSSVGTIHKTLEQTFSPKFLTLLVCTLQNFRSQVQEGTWEKCQWGLECGVFKTRLVGILLVLRWAGQRKGLWQDRWHKKTAS